MSSYKTLTEHIAHQTMELKDVNLCMSYVYTIWRDQSALVIFDNLNRKIIDTYFDVKFQNGDEEKLSAMVDSFLINS